MKRVLVVDDNPANLYLLRVLLKGHGFEVDACADGAQALETALRNPPDLVISDLLMPVMDGYTLLRHWKADGLLRFVPFVVYTATYTALQDRALAFDMGADAFIIKPTEPELLMQQINDVLDNTAYRSSPRLQTVSEQETLKLYNEVLVKKLEQRGERLQLQVAELLVAEAGVQRLNRRYAVLSAVNKAIVQIDDRDLLFQTVCRVAVEEGGFKLAWIGMTDFARGEIVPVAWQGAAQEWFASIGPFGLYGKRRTPAEIAVGEGRIYLSNDLLADPALMPIHDDLASAGLCSAAACPLRMGSHDVGVLTIFSGEKDCFDGPLEHLVTELAADVSFALENFEKDEIRRQTEEELRRLNAELEERIRARTAELVETNKELEAFNYSVSHDLRSPLAAISGFSGLVLKKSEGQLDEVSRGLLNRVVLNAARMARLIEDLLDLARASRQQMHTCEFDLSELAQSVADGLRLSSPDRVVEVSITAGLTVNADPGLIRIVLENLMGNAWKFTARTTAARIEMGSEQGAEGLNFFVRDNGAGFDMAHAGKLFSPFERMHNAGEFEGSGIGLSTVQRIVKRHGGRVWAEANIDHGATLRFTLR